MALVDEGAQRPKEYVRSVDLALEAILRLRDEGAVSVSGLAGALGISPSTAHRTLQMLVYRGFASRSAGREYLPGPALSSTALQPGIGAKLIAIARPYLAAATAECRETSHLVIRTGNRCHFIHSEEGPQSVRVGNRRGQIIAAEKNSGGLAMLAELPVSDLRALYPSLKDAQFTELRRKLHRFRTQGFSVNPGLFEHDVSALGIALFNDIGDVLAAMTIAVPTHRFPQERTDCLRALRRHGAALNRALAPTTMPALGLGTPDPH